MFNNRLKIALKVLEETGISRWSYAPLIYRLFWMLKIAVPPPHFRSFKANFFTMAIFAGPITLLIMWTRIVQNDGSILLLGGLTVLLAGVLFGYFMATYYRHGQSKYELPSWEKIQP